MNYHNGRVAIVTGANSGIGEAIARRLAQDGATIMLVARNAASLEAVRNRFEGDGFKSGWISIDLGKRGAPAEVIAKTVATFGHVDILVNCASLTLSLRFMEISDQQWDDAFAVKVHGAIRLFREAWPQLKANKGMVVNIGGIGARTPRANRGMTGVLSAALMAATKIMADEGLKAGVRVNMINPGTVATPRIMGVLRDRARDEGITLDEAMARRLAEISSLRMGHPEDTANLLAYILSPQGEMLHGSIIDLDGGSTKGL